MVQVERRSERERRRTLQIQNPVDFKIVWGKLGVLTENVRFPVLPNYVNCCRIIDGFEEERYEVCGLSRGGETGVHIYPGTPVAALGSLRQEN